MVMLIGMIKTSAMRTPGWVTVGSWVIQGVLRVWEVWDCLKAGKRMRSYLKGSCLRTGKAVTATFHLEDGPGFGPDAQGTGVHSDTLELTANSVCWETV